MRAYFCVTCGAPLEYDGTQRVVVCSFCGVSQTIESEEKVEIDYAKLEKQKETDDQYKKYTKMISQADSFIYSARDFQPVISFFEKNFGYKDGFHQLALAKRCYIERVSNDEEITLAEKYLNEITFAFDTKELRALLEKKKKSFRNKWLNKKKLLFATCCSNIDSFCRTISALFVSCSALQANYQSLTGEEIEAINSNQEIARSNIRNNYASVVEGVNTVELLNRLKTTVLEYNSNNASRGQTLDVSPIDNKIAKIEEEIATINKRKIKKRFINITIIALSATIVAGLIVGLIVGYNYNHSPHPFSFKVTSKTQYYNPDVSPYTNGCYYIYLDYNISSKSSAGVDYLTLKTTVSKNGNQLGYIRTSFENISLSPHSSRTYTTYLSDNQPEANGNTFFITLYNADYSSLSFSYEVLSISFADGHYYFGPSDY